MSGTCCSSYQRSHSSSAGGIGAQHVGEDVSACGRPTARPSRRSGRGRRTRRHRRSRARGACAPRPATASSTASVRAAWPATSTSSSSWMVTWVKPMPGHPRLRPRGELEARRGPRSAGAALRREVDVVLPRVPRALRRRRARTWRTRRAARWWSTRREHASGGDPPVDGVLRLGRGVDVFLEAPLPVAGVVEDRVDVEAVVAVVTLGRGEDVGDQRAARGCRR